MSYNHTYQNHQVCEINRDRAKCKPKHPKSKNILLQCGEGTGSRTFTSANVAPFQLAHVTLNTTCFNKSEVLIKFSSLVRVERLDDGATARLKYELLRTFEDEEAISIGTWMVEKVNISTSDFNRATEESFNFIFCECQACSGCCDYFVRVTPIEITNATATVSNGRMASLTQSLKVCSKDECDSECTKPELSKSKDTVLACGNGSGGVVFRTENEPPVQIASVTVDASSLCKPKILIEFSSIVDYLFERVTNATVSFQFELLRICDNGEPISRGVWNYEVGVVQGEIHSIQGFGFTFCECVKLSGCYEYFVIVTPIEVPAIGFDNSAINNSRMTALAQSSKSLDERCDTTDCRVKTHKFKEILLECGQGSGSRTFTASGEAAFQLAQVFVDTTGISKPIVNIEFSSIVNFVDVPGADDLEALLRYELFRVCEDGSAELRGVWVLARIGQDSNIISQSFDFTFCEPIICKKGCCTYFVKVTPIEIVNGEVTVSNGRMAALVGEGY